MSRIEKLEAHKKILETKRELAKKRWEICRRETALKYHYVTDEKTIDANVNALNNWMTQLKLIQANKRELECWAAKAGNYTMSLDEFQNLVAIFQILSFLTAKFDECAKIDVRELLDQSSVLVEMQNLLTKVMRSYNGEYTSIMKFVDKLK